MPPDDLKLRKMTEEEIRIWNGAYAAGFAEGAKEQKKRDAETEVANQRCTCSGCGYVHEYQSGVSGVAAAIESAAGELAEAWRVVRESP